MTEPLLCWWILGEFATELEVNEEFLELISSLKSDTFEDVMESLETGLSRIETLELFLLLFLRMALSDGRRGIV